MGAVLRSKGHDVKIYVEDLGPINYDDLRSADIVGISTTSSTAPHGYAIAERLREAGVPVVIGGPHATFCSEEALTYAPYCMRGEADTTFADLIDRIASHDEPNDVPGVSYKRGDEIIHNPMAERITDLDSLPFPGLDLIDSPERTRIRPVLTSRGCPFDCTFCSVTGMFGKTYRTRSLDNILEELEGHRNKQVFFYDDNFAASPSRAKEICEAIIRNNLNIGWGAQVRADVAKDDELLRLLQRAGCGMLFIGLESVNPETLKAYNKKQKVEDIESCIKKLHKHKILIHGMFISGSDQDDASSVSGTVDFAIKHHVDTIQCSVLTPLPGSKLYDDLEKENRIFLRDWSLYDGGHVVFEPKKMSPLALQQETVRVYQKFYTFQRCAKAVVKRRFVSAWLRYFGTIETKRWEESNRDFVNSLRNFVSRQDNGESMPVPASGAE
jgi:radical SAM superfamily enzyme YgiQ (UPF0313 family)